MGVSRRYFIVSAGSFFAGMGVGPLKAAESRETYATQLKAEKSIKGYWRLDGDLKDVLGKLKANTSGKTSFADGAMEDHGSGRPRGETDL